MAIRPLGGTSAPAASGGARRSTGSTFSVTPSMRGVDEASEAMPVYGVSLESLLSLQEVEPAPERDRRARRHAESILDLLTGLQRSLLDESGPADTAGRLAELGRQQPVAADPLLRAVVSAITVRAHVELARQEMAAKAVARVQGPGANGKRTA